MFTIYISSAYMALISVTHSLTLYPSLVQESGLVVQALRLNTMSKLTFADSFRFDALVKGVFPWVSFMDVEDQTLTRALEQAYSEA